MEETVVEIISKIFSVAAPFAEKLWENIVIQTLDVFWTWLTETLMPVIPEISEYIVQTAFASINNATKATFSSIKKAWEILRTYLLGIYIYIEKNPLGQWIKKYSSRLIKFSKLGKPVIVQRKVEEVVTWEELPSDIRERHIQRNQKQYEIDFTEIRDKEMRRMDLSN